MTDPSGTTNYTAYNNRDRLLTKATPEGTLNYMRIPVKSITVPEGRRSATLRNPIRDRSAATLAS